MKNWAGEEHKNVAQKVWQARNAGGSSKKKNRGFLASQDVLLLEVSWTMYFESFCLCLLYMFPSKGTSENGGSEEDEEPTDPKEAGIHAYSFINAHVC